MGQQRRPFLIVGTPTQINYLMLQAPYGKSVGISQTQISDLKIRLDRLGIWHLISQDTEIKLFECYQPQLANFNKRDLQQVVDVMGGTTFWIEEKLDGERIQLHKQGRKFRFFSRCNGPLFLNLIFSRKAKDYTYLYGSSLDDPDSSLTRFLTSAFVENCEE